jgi:hypothetical protein
MMDYLYRGGFGIPSEQLRLHFTLFSNSAKARGN